MSASACPECDNEDTRVVLTKWAANQPAVRIRLRSCQACEHRWYSAQAPEVALERKEIAWDTNRAASLHPSALEKVARHGSLPKGTWWSEEEAAFLNELLGEEPLELVTATYRREARRRGWPPRTVAAIQNRARRTGQRTGCRAGEWLTTGGAAELLGVPLGRMTRWLADPAIAAALTPKRVGGNWFISRRGFRRMARQMPERFGGFGHDRLLALLEDVELVEQLVAEHPVARSDYRVRCVETGQVFPSCTEAGRRHHVSPRTISEAIKRGRPVQSIGLSFVALRNEKAQPCKQRTGLYQQQATDAGEA